MNQCVLNCCRWMMVLFMDRSINLVRHKCFVEMECFIFTFYFLFIFLDRRSNWAFFLCAIAIPNHNLCVRHCCKQTFKKSHRIGDCTWLCIPSISKVLSFHYRFTFHTHLRKNHGQLTQLNSFRSKRRILLRAMGPNRLPPKKKCLDFLSNIRELITVVFKILPVMIHLEIFSTQFTLVHDPDIKKLVLPC